jgi:3-phenylpropionate/trans-cinnamate dioxygenase ferredoxin subunit
MSFVKVAEKSEVPVGRMKKIELEGKEILIANVGGSYYALGNRCTHMGGDLSMGTLEGSVVTCPRHGSKFDVTTGKAISGPKILFLKLGTKHEPSFEVKVEGEAIFIKMN